jgi:hypothetical protein
MNHRLLLEIALHEAVTLSSPASSACAVASPRLFTTGMAMPAAPISRTTAATTIAVLAGRAATEELLGYASDEGCSVDDAQAIALLMAPGLVEREPWYAQGRAPIVARPGRGLIRKHRAAVECVARELLDRGTLSGAEIDTAI